MDKQSRLNSSQAVRYWTEKGTDASTRCYSIIESAKPNDLNVFGYLTNLLTELPKLGDATTNE
ncbi:MAG: transposase domain-containing protein [Lachnospiraceae bacterium]|nr:transposase domain-containing protein [Lachnospiraceae bacterium]